MLLSVDSCQEATPLKKRSSNYLETKTHRGDQSFGMPTGMVVWVETT